MNIHTAQRPPAKRTAANTVISLFCIASGSERTRADCARIAPQARGSKNRRNTQSYTMPPPIVARIQSTTFISCHPGHTNVNHQAGLFGCSRPRDNMLSFALEPPFEEFLLIASKNSLSPRTLKSLSNPKKMLQGKISCSGNEVCSTMCLRAWQ